MRRVLILLLAVFMLFSMAYSADQSQIKKIERVENIPQFLGYAQDRLIVQLKETETGKSVAPRLSSVSGTAVTGIQSLDAIAENYGVTEMHQQFVGAKPLTKNGQTIDLSRHPGSCYE